MTNQKEDELRKSLDFLLDDEDDVMQSERAQRNNELRENRRKRAIKRRNRRIKRFLILIFVIIIAGGITGLLLYRNNLAYRTCRIEAGGLVEPSDFLKQPDASATYAKDSAPVDTNIPGEYKVKIKVGMFTVTSTLIVQDTVAPVFEVCDKTMPYGKTCAIEEFVTELTDQTKVSLAYVTEPDFSKSGKQTVTINATDLGGNTVTKSAELWLSPIYSRVSVELGSALPEASELVVEGVKAEYVRAEADCNTVGTYPVLICADGVEYEVILVVEDTTGPELEVKEFMDYAVFEKKPEDFVRSVEDISGVASVEFLEVPDFDFIGEQIVTIVATDTFGNQTLQETKLIQVPDEDAPIFLSGDDFTVYIGDTIAYKSKVTYTDNCEVDLNLSVDATAVDIKTEGTYPVIYTATDAAGNSSTKTLNVTVKVYRADEVALEEKIDAIFEKIFKEGMTNRERCKAIYDYIRRTVSYVSYSEKGDYIKAAMEGLTKGKGDCYVYYSLSKAMLTRAGFPNMDIERIRVGDSMHFWNLVDIGDGHGWYHFDTTPRVGGPYIFLWDDKTIWEYSDSHKGSHNYDKSLYPEIK